MSTNLLAAYLLKPRKTITFSARDRVGINLRNINERKTTTSDCLSSRPLMLVPSGLKPATPQGQALEVRNNRLDKPEQRGENPSNNS